MMRAFQERVRTELSAMTNRQVVTPSLATQSSSSYQTYQPSPPCMQPTGPPIMPTSSTSAYGPPESVPLAYGAPANPPAPAVGASAYPASSYGPPASPPLAYGAPANVPAPAYGAPSNAAPSYDPPPSAERSEAAAHLQRCQLEHKNIWSKATFVYSDVQRSYHTMEQLRSSIANPTNAYHINTLNADLTHATNRYNQLRSNYVQLLASEKVCLRNLQSAKQRLQQFDTLSQAHYSNGASQNYYSYQSSAASSNLNHNSNDVPLSSSSWTSPARPSSWQVTPQSAGSVIQEVPIYKVDSADVPVLSESKLSPDSFEKRGFQSKLIQTDEQQTQLDSKLGDDNCKSSKVQDDDDKPKCVICCDVLGKESVRVLPCVHVFHDECISEWLQRKNTCPVCLRPGNI